MNEELYIDAERLLPATITRGTGQGLICEKYSMHVVATAEYESHSTAARIRSQGLLEGRLRCTGLHRANASRCFIIPTIILAVTMIKFPPKHNQKKKKKKTIANSRNGYFTTLQETICRQTL